MSWAEIGSGAVKISGVVSPVVAGWFAWRKWSYERSIERAERLERILNGFRKDEVVDTFYRYIEHGVKFYDEDEHDFVVDDEKKIDALLEWFSFLCYLRRRKVICDAEFSEFAYQISKTVENPQVQAYCTDLYTGEKEDVTYERPFVELVRYGKDHGCKRMRDLYDDFCGRNDIWGKVKAWLCIRKGDCEQAVHEDEVTPDDASRKEGVKDNRNPRLSEFKQYLHRYYSVKSAASICWCAQKASELLDRSLDEMTNSTGDYARVCEDIAGLNIKAKLIGNLKHAVDKYWKFRNGVPPRPMARVVLLLILILSGPISFAGIAVSDVKVFSGYPWKEVMVGYTITGTDTDPDAVTDVIQLTATDKSANKAYVAQSLTGAVLTEGRHVLRWNAAAEGAKFTSANVVFSVSVVRLGVQLWENGPYWAQCNVGATKPEESGYYFWWGDTVGYKRNAGNNGWVSVKDGKSFSFLQGNSPTYGKSDSQLKSAGYIDSTGNLVAKYDAATKYFGSPWRMPTDGEWSALRSNCTSKWTTRNGVNGLLVTGKGAYVSKSIFLPATGIGLDSRLDASNGNYWSSSPISSSSGDAWHLYFNSGSVNLGWYYRYGGHAVRPVRGFAK